jgi:ABC-type thiamine transport system ATPase subunit
VADWVAQVDHERVEVVGQAASGSGEPTLVEVIDECLEPAFGVLFVDRFIQGLPVDARPRRPTN